LEPGGRRGMGIRASFRGRGEWLVSRRVRGKTRPRETEGGTVKEIVRPPAKTGDVAVVVKEVGRLSFGGVGGREVGGFVVLLFEANTKRLCRSERWSSCEDDPKRGSDEAKKSTLLRQRMVIAGLHFEEIWRVVSRMMSRRPTVFGGADDNGGSSSTRFAGGWIL
jgi:hypothetical protein